MAYLFRSGNAALQVQRSSPALLTGIKISKLNADSGSGIGLLITGIAMSQGVRIAYFTTLSESIYVYPLGNKVGKCMITGIALPSCAGSEDNYSNLAKLLDFYKDNKASNFQNILTPITVTIGKTPISGYLEDMQINITNESNMFGSASFNLTLSVFPDF